MILRSPARVTQLRTSNRALVLAAIRRSPGLSRSQLARVTSLTEASLSRIARDLIESGLVHETEAPDRSPQRGRPKVGLLINPNAHYVLAICRTADEQNFSLFGLSGQRLWEGALRGSFAAPISEVLQEVSDCFAKARHGPDVRLMQPLGVTIACSSAILQAQTSFPPIGSHTDMDGLSLPLHVTNVASALHIAEIHQVSAASVANSLLIYGGLELGVSLMVDGRVQEHVLHDGWVGGIPVGRDMGKADRAKLLTLDEISSGRAVLASMRGGMVTNTATTQSALMTGLPHAVRQANAGDPKAVAAFQRAGQQLALSHVALVALLRLQRVVLAGPLSAAKPYMDAFSSVFSAVQGQAAAHAPDICRSRINYLQAAEFMALSHFVFDDQSSNA